MRKIEIEILPMAEASAAGQSIVSEVSIVSAPRIPVSTFPYRFGRKPDQDFVLTDSHISGTHAEIVQEADVFTFVDHSMNGSHVNGVKVHRSNVPLADKDIVKIHDHRFRIHITEVEGDGTNTQAPSCAPTNCET